MGAKRPKLYVVVSGLPASGKSTLARSLAPLLRLAVIDKDDILERLFAARGTGGAEWRRALSRESDLLLHKEASEAEGAVLVSFWRLPGMIAGSGTPTDWLTRLSDRIVNVVCLCPPELAAERFFRRTRHPGHLDSQTSKEDVLSRIQAVARFGRLKLGTDIEVDTSTEVVDVAALAETIRIVTRTNVVKHPRRRAARELITTEIAVVTASRNTLPARVPGDCRPPP